MQISENYCSFTEAILILNNREKNMLDEDESEDRYESEESSDETFYDFGYLIDIAIKREKRAPMEILDSAEITIESGIVGDYRGPKNKNRQITLLSEQQWSEACRELGLKVLPWIARRANLFVRGISFGSEHLGQIIEIGEVILEITGETTPCARMDEAQTGLKTTLAQKWRGGVTCKVIRGGKIKVNDLFILK